MTELRLLVLRTTDIKRLSDFYSLIGLAFEYHKHGTSPYHYSAQIGKTILEIYPLAKNQNEADKNFRLGLGLDNFDQVIQVLKKLQISFLLEPTETEFGFMAIVADPDQRKVELYRNH